MEILWEKKDHIMSKMFSEIHENYILMLITDLRFNTFNWIAFIAKEQ